MTLTATQSFNPDSLEVDDFVHVDLDQLLTLRHRIDELTIPAIRGTQIIRSVFMLIFFVIPCIFGLVYINVYIAGLQEPLEFISSLSMLRSYTYQVITFSLRYIGENLTVFPRIENPKREPPEYFGNTWDTREQLKFIVTETSDAVQKFGSFRKFEQGNIYIKPAQDLIFGNSLEYKYFTSPKNFTFSSLSIQSAVMDLVIQQNALLSNNSVSGSIVNTSIVLNPCYNSNNLTESMNNALEYLILYIDEVYEETTFIANICMYSIIVFVIIINFVSLTIQLIWLKIDKQETYQCLFSLPKNTVSALAENLRVLKKDNPSDNSFSNNNTEMNKQEENILKIFNSSGSNETPISDIFLPIFVTVIITCLTIGCVVLFVQLVKNESISLKESAPHLNYMMGSYAMMMNTFDNLFLSFLYFTPYRVHLYSIDEVINFTMESLRQSRDYYHLTSYGGDNSSPFSGFDDGVAHAQQSITCNTTTDVPENFGEAVSCYPADMAFILIEPILTYKITPYTQGIIDELEYGDDSVTVLWQQMISPLYNNFFYPMHLTIIPTIEKELKEGSSNTIPGIIIMLIVAILVEVFSFVQLYLIEAHIRSVLRLFLHCPPDIVLSTPKIMKLLSGDFSTQRADSMNRDSEFFDSVFVSLPDAIMYANSEMIIQAANLSCQRIFGDVPLVDHSIKEFFASDKFIGNINVLFSSANTNPVEPIIYRKDDGTEMHLEASSMLASGKFVMSCRDVTQTVRYNTLIREERAKSDQLLATILPPSLVKRVQEGEKNISFAVQSASILFSDIVEFTPWCGALPAATVMSTLNILFRRLDAILATKPTMTKIKCIGDCYMAAGGIFAEINQPTEHAKEVVTFGLDSIRAILDINKEIGEKLKIRVGVNTGGPIVAGVLGIGKPTFEILGPAINMAQQMEHHGVPMAVHITRAVYELIYGDTFTIRERGAVQVKGGSVITYLVTQKS
ncbi:Adenylate and Guanylate cyclase catalytic domain containing protein [Tritrichomonas foetus]|uniref:Adenylate and Guanylate cyclase catalytic domain containing protein n=1 Tax=Tritrichomonas foetus TaxID=1144522 RepID=A0A1J4KEU1_9EUKA|nr:Adenylate and Guanylate cyclase catalytic domain containing protein [Tritrichomonas foetus]|eukprot:OHT09546.1 Adenylate and Guanylate cyclase catalytic domain containing protein [Tritrichomonas foetus]